MNVISKPIGINIPRQVEIQLKSLNKLMREAMKIWPVTEFGVFRTG